MINTPFSASTQGERSLSVRFPEKSCTDLIAYCRELRAAGQLDEHIPWLGRHGIQDHCGRLEPDEVPRTTIGGSAEETGLTPFKAPRPGGWRPRRLRCAGRRTRSAGRSPVPDLMPLERAPRPAPAGADGRGGALVGGRP